MSDLAEVIIATGANQDHDVDFREAERRALANRDLLVAVGDYDEHCERARSAAAKVEYSMKWDRYTRQEAVERLAAENISPEDALRHVFGSLQRGSDL
ncbi:hypothetical protein [Devosia sp.]|uniref:hypothetical protein n=1 Tax=Devosia sp. TaxID=1871048 RepID=UPI003F728D47